MTKTRCKTPVALIAFNRPQLTAQVLDAIQEAAPSKLFLIVDGPRPGHPTDDSRCEEVRRILNTISWECEVSRRYAKENLGCRRNVAEGITWIFQEVSEAIILEDDCLPSPSFFRFCEELLERYRDDTRIGMISGDNFQFGKNTSPESYYFSRFAHIWGWATWRRAWAHYDLEVTEWPSLRDSEWLRRICSTRAAERYWKALFNDSYFMPAGGLNTWDVAWLFTCWKRQFLSIVPNRNLVTNIGFGADSTRTRKRDLSAGIPAGEIPFPLQHPDRIVPFRSADDFTERSHYYGRTLLERIFWNIPAPLTLAQVRQFRAAVHRWWSALQNQDVEP